jgi:thiamine biosynthesis protein ThiC
MKLYVIRRESGWGTPQELQAAAARSKQVGDDEMSADIRWIRSYVVEEADGALGTVCIYQASSPEKIQEHAQRAGLPADAIFPVADTVILRADPVQVAS